MHFLTTTPPSSCTSKPQFRPQPNCFQFITNIITRNLESIQFSYIESWAPFHNQTVLKIHHRKCIKNLVIYPNFLHIKSRVLFHHNQTVLNLSSKIPISSANIHPFHPREVGRSVGRLVRSVGRLLPAITSLHPVVCTPVNHKLAIILQTPQPQ